MCRGISLLLTNDHGNALHTVAFLQMMFFDTEGFESTGKADVYDDRIFALATLVSSVLIYNLPESIRESDLEKLSFAVELAKAFYTPGGSDSHSGRAGPEEPAVQPGSMVWLIQRDFLQGSTLTDTLRSALRQVPNPHKDNGISQLNRIRQGLAAIAANSTALGLPQPHLDRTRLCDMRDEALDPGYVKRRDELKRLVRSLAAPKIVKGTALNGPALADLITEVVTALNAREIPTAGSLLEYFNKELVTACRDQFIKSLESVALPSEAEALTAAAEAAAQAARAKFEEERFGSDVQTLREVLEAALKRELETRETANTYESSRVCEAAEMECENVLEHEAAQKLPSTGRFAAKFEKCKEKFNARCVGPGKEHNEGEIFTCSQSALNQLCLLYALHVSGAMVVHLLCLLAHLQPPRFPPTERLLRAWERENSRFSRDYNDRLYNGLVLVSVAAIVLFRFAAKWTLGESAAWAAFIFLQVYPRTFLGSSSSMFDTAWWQTLVAGWEAAVNNPVVDVERWGLPLVLVLGVAYFTRRHWLWRVHGLVGRRRGKRSKSVAEKDLEV